MIKVYKLRIYPNKTQINIINKTLGACRWIWNKYIEYNQKVYDEKGVFLSAYEFSKTLTQLKKTTEEFSWLNEISQKAVKDSIMNCEKSYKKFFKKSSNRPPKFKSKKDLTQSYFFVKDQLKIKHNKIKLPILKWVSITENDYIKDIKKVTGGRIIKGNDKYYIILNYICDTKDLIINESNGLGIDLGVENFASIFDGVNSITIPNFNDEEHLTKLEDKKKRLQKIISNKVEINKKKERRDCYNTSKIRKINKKVNKIYEKMNNIRQDYIKKLCYSLVIAKPEYITIEDLNITNMLQNANHTLANHIAQCKFYYFKTHLISKCKEYNIELRQANRWFASSKKCSNCGYKNKKLTLADRIYCCSECGLVINRDLNAAINLQKLSKYTIINTL